MESYKIEIIPGNIILDAYEGDNLYTLLLVNGIIDSQQENAERVKLEKGQISPSEDRLAEEQVFSSAELLDGWMLASLHRVKGDALIVISQDRPAESAGPLCRGYGLVVDIGLTTITAGIVSTLGSHIPILTSMRSSLERYGKDMSDFQAYCRNNSDGAGQIAKSVSNDIRRIAQKLVVKIGISLSEIQAVIISGNAFLCRILRGTDWEHPLPEDIGRIFNLNKEKKDELSFANAEFWMLPLSQGDLGPDTVAAIMATELYSSLDDDKITLLVDLDTEGKVIGIGRGRMIAATVSPLPFEGSGVTCGMTTTTGAITSVQVENDVIVQTVRDGYPQGVSGSGLLSIVHELLRQGIIDQDGRITVGDDFPDRVIRRFRNTIEGREFIVSYGAKGRDIYINYDDIMAVQMARAGIYGAAMAVLGEFDASIDDIGHILFAESFDSYLQPIVAREMELTPGLDKIIPTIVGNASWQGAYLALCNRMYLGEAKRIAKTLEKLDLTADVTYAEQFIQAMTFPLI